MSAAIQRDWPVPGILLLTLDQPGSKVNVLTTALWQELYAILEEQRSHSELRGLILQSGKPGIFIAGADLNELKDADPAHPEPTRQFIEHGLITLFLLESLPVPTCAIIDGVALGGGLEVALACDLILFGTHPRVEMGLPEIKLGLIPGWGGTQRLPRRIGADAALQALLSGESFKGCLPGMEQWSAPHLPEADLVQSAIILVQRMSTDPSWLPEREQRLGPCPPPATVSEPNSPAGRELVALLDAGCRLPLPQAIALELAAFLRLAGTSDSRERIAEFFARRKKN